MCSFYKVSDFFDVFEQDRLAVQLAVSVVCKDTMCMLDSVYVAVGHIEDRDLRMVRMLFGFMALWAVLRNAWSGVQNFKLRMLHQCIAKNGLCDSCTYCELRQSNVASLATHAQQAFQGLHDASTPRAKTKNTPVHQQLQQKTQAPISATPHHFPTRVLSTSY